MNKPLVSIIIPTYNRANFIGETLDSIIAQTYENWECIIVDDGSTDNTETVINNYLAADSRFQYYHRPKDKPKGGNACRNYGFEKIRGEFVNWFDSDDLMHPDFILFKTKAFLDSNLEAVISKRITFDSHNVNKMTKETRTFLSSNLLEDFLIFKISFYLPDVMWMSSYLENKILFDENLLIGQDRDFHTRMLLNEPRISVIDAYLTKCRAHSESITSEYDLHRNVDQRISYINGIFKLIAEVESAGKLTRKIRFHYFNILRGYIVLIHKDVKASKKLYKLLSFLYFPNVRLMLYWIKYRITEHYYRYVK